MGCGCHTHTRGTWYMVGFTSISGSVQTERVEATKKTLRFEAKNKSEDETARYTPSDSPNRQNEPQDTGWARFSSPLLFSILWTAVKKVQTGQK